MSTDKYHAPNPSMCVCVSLCVQALVVAHYYCCLLLHACAWSLNFFPCIQDCLAKFNSSQPLSEVRLSFFKWIFFEYWISHFSLRVKSSAAGFETPSLPFSLGVCTALLNVDQFVLSQPDFIVCCYSGSCQMEIIGTTVMGRSCNRKWIVNPCIV